MEQAEALKQAGNEQFKAGEFEQAAQQYRAGLAALARATGPIAFSAGARVQAHCTFCCP